MYVHKCQCFQYIYSTSWYLKISSSCLTSVIKSIFHDRPLNILGFFIAFPFLYRFLQWDTNFSYFEKGLFNGINNFPCWSKQATKWSIRWDLKNLWHLSQPLFFIRITKWLTTHALTSQFWTSFSLNYLHRYYHNSVNFMNRQP